MFRDNCSRSGGGRGGTSSRKKDVSVVIRDREKEKKKRRAVEKSNFPSTGQKKEKRRNVLYGPT